MHCPNCSSVLDAETQACVCGYSAGVAAIALLTPNSVEKRATRQRATQSLDFAGHPVIPAAAATQTVQANVSNAAFSFHGSGGKLLGIQMVNMLLTVLTLGLYFPWAKAKSRRYLTGEMAFANDRFAYHGTGKQLFMGSLKAMLILGGLMVGLAGVTMLLGPIGSFLATAVVFGLTPIAIYGTLRSRLAQTSWKGMPFSLQGDGKGFLKVFLPNAVLTSITFGIWAPVFLMENIKYVLNNLSFGGQRFSFDGQGKELLWRHFRAGLLSLVTFGIYQNWFMAELLGYVCDHTRIGGARFKSSMTGGELFKHNFVNGLLIVFTLGIALPWVLVRQMRFVLGHLALAGNLDLNAMPKKDFEASATQDGMSDMLDVEFGL